MRFTVLAVSLLALVIPATAQEASEAPDISTILKGMKNASWSKRSKAFGQATDALASGKLSTKETDDLKLGVIQLLIAENALAWPPDKEAITIANKLRKAGEIQDEEYYPSLVSYVADMNDERAIPALAGTPESIATSGLLKYGDKARGPLFDQLRAPNALVRAGAIGTIIAFWGNDPAFRSRIREALRSALTDPDAAVRGNAVNEIACLDDRKDFVAVIETLAKSDPVHYKGRADDGLDGDQFYPVRVDARRALREIRENQPCSSRH